MSAFQEGSGVASAGAGAHVVEGGAWATLREAIRGSRIDYTTAPVGRGIVMLAVPMVMEMAMESIFVLADVFWVAHLGAAAVATVAVIVGANLSGILGALLAIPTAASLGVVIDELVFGARSGNGSQENDAAQAAPGEDPGSPRTA